MERLYLESDEVRALLGLTRTELHRWTRAGLGPRALRTGRQHQFSIDVIRELVPPQRQGVVDALARRSLALALPFDSSVEAWVRDRIVSSPGAIRLDDLKADCLQWHTDRGLDLPKPQTVTWAVLRAGYPMVPTTVKAKPAAYRVIVGARLRHPGESREGSRTLLPHEQAVADGDPEILALLHSRSAVAIPQDALAAAFTAGVKPFVAQCCRIDPDAVSATRLLHGAYRGYCETVQMPPVSQRRFAELLARLGYPMGDGHRAELTEAVRRASRADHYRDVRLGLALRDGV
jgi:hypothetical protein